MAGRAGIRVRLGIPGKRRRVERSFRGIVNGPSAAENNVNAKEKTENNPYVTFSDRLFSHGGGEFGIRILVPHL